MFPPMSRPILHLIIIIIILISTNFERNTISAKLILSIQIGL